MSKKKFHLALRIPPAVAPLLDRTQLRAAVAAALQEKPPATPVELSLVITDDEEIRRLNRTYRGLDAPTDVLAFHTEGAPLPVEETPYLGDILISFPRVVEQAAEYGHSPQVEMNLLIIHGVLHLLGYDHETEEARQEMWQLQDRALSRMTSH